MGKLVLITFNLGASLVAGLIGKRLFAVIWGVIDDEQPPKPEHRDVPIARLVLALTIEGIIISVTRGIVSHGFRHAYARLTGSWPGDEQPESNETTLAGQYCRQDAPSGVVDATPTTLLLSSRRFGHDVMARRSSARRSTSRRPILGVLAGPQARLVQVCESAADRSRASGEADCWRVRRSRAGIERS